MINWRALRGQVIAIPALVVAGCGSSATPEETTRNDATDVAAVEAAQNRRPPIEPITPEGITPEDRKRNDQSGAGCAFLPDGVADALPIVVALPQTALIKFGDKVLVLAADSASAALSSGVRAEYVGRTHALHLAERAEGDGALLTITDRFERPVFATLGLFDCNT